MTRPSRPIQRRARYFRNPQPWNDLLVNSPGGFPSDFPPISQTTAWWMGSDLLNSRPLDAPESLSAVQRASNLITQLGALPVRILTGGATPRLSRFEAPTPRWITDPMLHRPDERYGSSPTSAAVTLTRSKFWSEFIRSALLRGRGCLVFEEDAGSQPVAGTLRLLNPDLVTPAQDGYGGPVVRRIGVQGEPGVETSWDGRFPLGSRTYRLLELLNPLSPVDEYGSAMGVLELCHAEMMQAVSQVRYGSSMYRSGVPSGYLKVSVPNFGKERADALSRQWNEAHSTGERQTAVLNATTDYVPIQMSPVDLALIQSRQMALLDIANAFGVPSYMLGGTDGGSNTYSNAESRNRDFVSYSLNPWTYALEDLFTSLLPTGQFVEVDLTQILRADMATRYAGYHQALYDGWLTRDEVRLLEGLPPMKKGESLGTEIPGGEPLDNWDRVPGQVDEHPEEESPSEEEVTP